MFKVFVLFRFLWYTMALLRVEHHSIPVLFSFGEDDHAIVTCATLSLRFQYCEVTIFVEEEVFDDQSGLISHAVREIRVENGVSTFWLLKPGKYRVYGVWESMLECSTEFLTPRESSTVSVERHVLSKVKIEPGLNTIHELSDDSDGNVEFLKSERKVQASLSPQVAPKETIPPLSPSHNPGQAKVVARPVVSIIHSLMRLEARKRSKSVLSRINSDAIRLEQVDYLPLLTMGTLYSNFHF